MDQIRQQVLTGQLRPGQQLDTVRDLAGRLRVNPMTVSKAYSLLELEGVVERRHGIGLFVKEPSEDVIERERAAFLAGALPGVIAQAVQLGVTKEKLLRMVDRLFEQLTRKGKEERR